MKKILLALFVFHSFFEAHSQFREEAPSATITPNLSKLTNATGWVQDPENRWDSLPNVIPPSLSSSQKEMMDFEKYKLGVDNFQELSFHQLVFNSDTFFVFTKAFKKGWYEYPSIVEGWYEVPIVHGYVLEKSQVEKLKTLKDSTYNKITLSSIGFYEYRYKSVSEVIPLIEKEFDIKNDFRPSVVFEVNPFKSLGITQFLVYGLTEYSAISRPIRNVFKYGEDPFKSSGLIKKAYFECTHSAFESLISI